VLPDLAEEDWEELGIAAVDMQQLLLAIQRFSAAAGGRGGGIGGGGGAAASRDKAVEEAVKLLRERERELEERVEGWLLSAREVAHVGGGGGAEEAAGAAGAAGGVGERRPSQNSRFSHSHSEMEEEEEYTVARIQALMMQEGWDAPATQPSKTLSASESASRRPHLALRAPGVPGVISKVGVRVRAHINPGVEALQSSSSALLSSAQSSSEALHRQLLAIAKVPRPPA
jgi:hypothetical protein